MENALVPVENALSTLESDLAHITFPRGVWTRFMDMNSGGGRKFGEFSKILIEAPYDEARIIFQRITGRDPDHVTCNCCGEDYSVTGGEEGDDLASITGYDRNCRFDRATDRYVEEPRESWTGKTFGKTYTYELIPLPEYLARDDVFVVWAEDIEALENSNHGWT